jgi:hypothetical protein
LYTLFILLHILLLLARIVHILTCILLRPVFYGLCYWLRAVSSEMRVNVDGLHSDSLCLMRILSTERSLRTAHSGAIGPYQAKYRTVAGVSHYDFLVRCNLRINSNNYCLLIVCIYKVKCIPWCTQSLKLGPLKK